MSRFVIDADGLIKLGKSGILGALIRNHEVLVPEAVYEEAVVRGKRGLYEDAFELEEILKDEKVSAIPAATDPWADQLLEGVTSLGVGERAALHLYATESADAVLSDDRVFLNFLGRNAVPFLTPANVIVGLVRARQFSCEEALEALEKLSGYVRAEVYEKAKAELEDLRKESEEDSG